MYFSTSRFVLKSILSYEVNSMILGMSIKLFTFNSANFRALMVQGIWLLK